MNDLEGNLAAARMAKAGGASYVVAALVYSLSPIHDDAHYVERARALAASPDVDALYIKDPGGLLTPVRARTLIPAIRAVMGSKPLELHCHCTIGLGELAYMDAPDYGVSTVQCASGAAADGTSNPPSERVVANLRELGHDVPLDDAALAEVGAYFTRLAEAEDLPAGRPQAFDAAYLHHQLPGGVVGTMRRHLAEHRLSHVEAQVIEELGRVRQELGWPIVMTPFAQMVVTQAVMNVTGKERYGVIPDEIIRYALGRFGKPNIPIAPEVMDRIMSLPRTRELAVEPGMPPVAELRRRLGAGLSDEEFLLRATMPAELVDAMQPPGAAPRHYEPGSKAILDLIRSLTARRDLAQIVVEKPGFRLELSGGPEMAEA
jgi:oxaloacetate decarboxylase alpha subunit